jgi:hypothetical protein
MPDSVVPVLDADGNQTGTARLLVDSSGALVIVTDSASPQRPVAVQIAEYRERAAAAAASRATRIDAATKARAAGSAAAAANSVPALREQVAILAEQVRRLAEAP